MVHFNNDDFIINLKVGHSLIQCKFRVSLILKGLTGRLNRHRSNATECPQEYTWDAIRGKASNGIANGVKLRWRQL